MKAAQANAGAHRTAASINALLPSAFSGLCENFTLAVGCAGENPAKVTREWPT